VNKHSHISFVPHLLYMYSPIQDGLTDWYLISKIVTVISFKLQHFYFLTSYHINFQKYSLKMLHILTMESLYVIGL